jgi:hypothetical protein
LHRLSSLLRFAARRISGSEGGVSSRILAPDKRASMFEMPDAGEDHSEVMLIRGSDHFRVAD